MQVRESETSQWTYFLLLAFVCLLKLAAELLLLLLLGHPEGEEFVFLLRLLLPHPRLLQLCDVLRVHVEVFDAERQDAVKAAVDVSFNGCGVEEELE